MLEVGSQATQQPDHFQIARGLRLEPSAGAHPIDVSINVELKQIGRIVARSARIFRLNAPETRFLQVTLINERLNEAHRIFSTDVIINCYRQKQSLVTVVALLYAACSKYSCFYSTSGLFFDRSATH